MNNSSPNFHNSLHFKKNISEKTFFFNVFVYFLYIWWQKIRGLLGIIFCFMVLRGPRHSKTYKMYRRVGFSIVQIDSAFFLCTCDEGILAQPNCHLYFYLGVSIPEGFTIGILLVQWGGFGGTDNHPSHCLRGDSLSNNVKSPKRISKAEWARGWATWDEHQASAHLQEILVKTNTIKQDHGTTKVEPRTRNWRLWETCTFEFTCGWVLQLQHLDVQWFFWILGNRSNQRICWYGDVPWHEKIFACIIGEWLLNTYMETMLPRFVSHIITLQYLHNSAVTSIHQWKNR